MKLNDFEHHIFDWAEAKGLVNPELTDRQFMKMVEEVGEVGACISKDMPDSLRLEIGDVMVTLAILAFQNGLSLEDCASAAFRKIEHRKGKLIKGTFVKEEDL